MIWGEHAEKYPELLKEEAKCLLFTLGNHTYHHKDLTKLSIKEGKNEIAKNDEVIEKLKGIPCGARSTSCPDQLARALENIKHKM